MKRKEGRDRLHQNNVHASCFTEKKAWKGNVNKSIQSNKLQLTPNVWTGRAPVMEYIGWYWEVFHRQPMSMMPYRHSKCCYYYFDPTSNCYQYLSAEEYSRSCYGVYLRRPYCHSLDNLRMMTQLLGLLNSDRENPRLVNDVLGVDSLGEGGSQNGMERRTQVLDAHKIVQPSGVVKFPEDRGSDIHDMP